MPATRSSGPPSAASFQPVLMEALENFKQKHSKQNQDLIHKNRVLLKANAELERTIKDLKNENLELRVAARKAQSLLTQSSNLRLQQQPFLNNHLSTTNTNLNGLKNLENEKRIRAAVAEITAKCRALEASLESAFSLNHNQGPSEQNYQRLDNNDQSVGLGLSISSSKPLSSSSSSSSLNCESNSTFTTRTRAELIALRERRRSQLPTEAEESRLSFIHEGSGAEDRSESTSLESRQIEAEISSRGFLKNPSSSSSGLLQNDEFVVQRSTRRQNALMTCPESPVESNNSSSIETPPNLRSRSDKIRDEDENSDAETEEEHIEAELNLDRSNFEETVSQIEVDENSRISNEESIEKTLEENDGDSSEIQKVCPRRSYSSELSSPESLEGGEEEEESHHQNQNRKNKVGPKRSTQNSKLNKHQQGSIKSRLSRSNNKFNPKPLTEGGLISSQQILAGLSPSSFTLTSINHPLITEPKLEPFAPPPQSLHVQRRRRGEWDYGSYEAEAISNQNSDKAEVARKSRSQGVGGGSRNNGSTGPKQTKMKIGSRDDDDNHEEEEQEQESHPKASVDEGWSKGYSNVKMKRSRAELDAVKEEQPTNNDGLTELPINLSGSGQREARRARKEVNYALPSLNKKMRRPDGYVSSRPSTSNKRVKRQSRSSGATPSTISTNNKSTSLSLSSSPPPQPTNSSKSHSNSNHKNNNGDGEVWEELEEEEGDDDEEYEDVEEEGKGEEGKVVGAVKKPIKSNGRTRLGTRVSSSRKVSINNNSSNRNNNQSEGLGISGGKDGNNSKGSNFNGSSSRRKSSGSSIGRRHSVNI